jgi:predicted Zn-dependent protease with MMP-like domain
MNDRHARHRRPDADRRRRPVDGSRTSSPGRFGRLVDDALTSLPPALLDELDDVQVVVEDIPPALPDAEDEVLLGAFQSASGLDRITLFRRPLEARARNRVELTDLVRETIVRELADHRGIDEDRLGELGWD